MFVFGELFLNEAQRAKNTNLVGMSASCIVSKKTANRNKWYL